MSEVTGGVKWILRLEGAAILAVSLCIYAKIGFTWWYFLAFFLLPDAALLGYIINRRTGAILYNLTHSLIGPLGCIMVGVLTATNSALVAGTIWTAHIGFDRMLGYGLKYSQGFSYTHLGRIGSAKDA